MVLKVFDASDLFYVHLRVLLRVKDNAWTMDVLRVPGLPVI